MAKITIIENGIVAGWGDIIGGDIENCEAVLGGSQDMADEAYDAIPQAIANGDESVAIGEYTWTWVITPMCRVYEGGSDAPQYVGRMGIDDASNDFYRALIAEAIACGEATAKDNDGCPVTATLEE